MKKLSNSKLFSGLVFVLFVIGCNGGGGSGGDKPTLSLERALETGDASLVADEREFLDEALATIDEEGSRFDDTMLELFNLDARGAEKSDGSSLTGIDWNPTHDAAKLGATFGINKAILLSNSVTNPAKSILNVPLAVVGEYSSAGGRTKYLVMGASPMRNYYRTPGSLNDQMHQFLQNTVNWLVGRSDFGDKPLNAVIAHMAQSTYFPDQVATRSWLDEYYAGEVGYNDAGTCDGANLSGCISTDTDILIVSGNGTLEDVAGVKGAMDNGLPVLYMHLDGNQNDFSTELFSLLDVKYLGDNYWSRQQLANYNPADGFGALPSEVEMVKNLLIDLRDSSFTFDLAECSDRSCPGDSAYYREFGDPVDAVKDAMRHFDTNRIRLFDTEKYRYEKLLLLLADKYRQQVVFPLDKLTSGEMFLKSLYADHAVVNYRDINPAQSSLGRFGRSDFSQVTPIEKTVGLTAKVSFRAAGVYALPGRTFTATRRDDSEVKTTLFLNSLRSGATHEFKENGYNAPKFLRTVAVPIGPGETISLTSSHGGPIQIGFGGNDESVEFHFQDVGEHPFWNGPEDNDTFAARMAAADYDWAEIVTSGFEVHSTLDKMQSSIDVWGSAAELVEATDRYMGNLPYVLAGLQGPGIDVVSEIHDFATVNGWSINTLDKVQHMNADQATCGTGCSGNPYDANWAYSPIGHGDLHELGHGLEDGRFRFDGFESHAKTNYYSYYSKANYFRDTGLDPNCKGLPFESLFDLLQQSMNEPDPFAYMQAAGVSNWQQGNAIFMQLMMRAQKDGILQDGWHLLARLHLLRREFSRADDSDTAWDAARVSLGFDAFTRDQAKALSNNDWLLIAFSRLMQRDLRTYFTMWGIAFGAEAASQVASFGHALAPLEFFVSAPKEYCETLDIATLPVDGARVWPQ
jgi:hypothetical protein